MEKLFYILPLLSIFIAVITCLISLQSLKKRLVLENKLRNYLIEEICKKNLDLRELKTSLTNKSIKIQISSKVSEEDIELYKKELDECVKLAISRLFDNEQIVIKRAIDNSIHDGRSLYKDKVIHDSISKIASIKLA